MPALPWALRAGDPFSDAGHKLRQMARHLLPEAWSKLVQEVHPRVVSDRRAEVAERSRTRARPVAPRGTVGRHCSQHAQEIRSVQPCSSGRIPREKDSRSGVRGSRHYSTIRRGLITRSLLPRCTQILAEEVRVLTSIRTRAYSQRHFGSEMGRLAHDLCIDSNRAIRQGQARFIAKGFKLIPLGESHL